MSNKQNATPETTSQHDPNQIWGSKLRAKINCQKTLSNDKLLERDADLLHKNFDAFLAYLKGQAEQLEQDESLNQQTKNWLSSGGLDKLSAARLKDIFKAVAEDHQGFVRSECVIASARAHKEIIENGSDNISSVPTKANPRRLSFGFVRTQPSPDNEEFKLSVTFPIVALPNKITQLNNITVNHPMVKALQKIYTLTNHDWLHHMTMSALDKGICAYKNDDKKIEQWAEKHFSDSYLQYPVFDFGAHETLYEGWAIYTNAQLLNTSPIGKEIKADILMTAMQMINLGKDYIEQNNNSDRAMKTAYWFMLQTTKTLRSIIPVDGFEMRKFIEAAATHLPHPERYTEEHIEHIKYRLYEGHDAMCLLHSPHLAQDEKRQEKYQKFQNDNAKITAELIAHLDIKYS